MISQQILSSSLALAFAASSAFPGPGGCFDRPDAESPPKPVETPTETPILEQTPAPTLAVTPTQTLAPTPMLTPTQSSLGSHFPNGYYFFHSAWLFKVNLEGQDLLLTFFGEAIGGDVPEFSPEEIGSDFGEQDPPPMEHSGYWSLMYWNSQESYDEDEDFNGDCKYFDLLEGFEYVSGTAPHIREDTCVGCDPMNLWISRYLKTVEYADRGYGGCDDALFDLWYTDGESGEFNDAYWQYSGYRHAATEDWPAEFKPYAQDLEARGYQGSLYDELAGDVPGALGPNYLVRPLTAEESSFGSSATSQSAARQQRLLHTLRGQDLPIREVGSIEEAMAIFRGQTR